MTTSDFELSYHWADDGAELDPAEVPEFRATLAYLTVTVGQQVVTTVLDRPKDRVRDSLLVPLYPLAEWIAVNWWFLLYEVETPGLSESYAERHAIRYAGEGYAVPDLLIAPEGETTVLQWLRWPLVWQPIEFVSEGTASVPTESVRRSLARFLEAVLKRLRDLELPGTLLAQEWTAVKEAEGDPDLRAFCIAAARLGVDPFAADETQREKLLKTGTVLQDQALLDFLAATRIDTIDRDLDWLVGGMLRIAEAPPAFRRLHDLRARLSLPRAATPAEEGYALARRLRDELRLNGRIFSAEADLYGLFDAHDFNNTIVAYRSANRHFGAICAETREGTPGFILNKSRPDSRRFLFCRALHDYLRGEVKPVALITDTRSDRQKRNRAFAAEFLAPAHLLQRRIDCPVVGGDQVEELAEEFGVSERVIEHQIQNHRLARLIPD